MPTFVLELFEAMEKHRKLKSFTHFYIVPHCFYFLLKISLEKLITIHFFVTLHKIFKKNGSEITEKTVKRKSSKKMIKFVHNP